ncbi:MAG: aminotransferase class III-fold pyridoxal phosphate-dependent enzyme [Ginsengibacter sp.]
MNLSEEKIKEIVKENYGLVVDVEKLNGYDEQNFLLTDEQAIKYVLKVSNEELSRDFLDAQVKIINHLSKNNLSGNFQRFVLNHLQKEITTYAQDGKDYCIRILTFLEGYFWGDCKNLPGETYVDLGNFLGKMDNALKDFSHLAMHRHYTWDISTAADADAKLHFIKDHERRRIAAYFLLQFETEALPYLSSLRHAYIHNDTNDFNILIRDNKIAGLIDFGDSVYTALVNNLAVACTYSMLNNEDPLKAATLVVKGYHQSYPLQEKEIELLYYLIAGRLCISVTQSAWNASLNTNNEHHFITEKPAWELLFELIKINPIKAHNEFRKVCGFSSIIDEEDDYKKLLADRKKYIGKNLSISYQEPLKIIKGALQYLYDDKGNTFVDCVNNVSHVGHCHPVVVKAMQKQIASLNTNTRYLSDIIVDYAKALTDTLPKKLSVCYFVNSGSEANDLAIRIARHYTKQKDIIVLDHAYHGTSTLAIEMSPYKFDGKGGFKQKPYIHKAVSPDLYRGQFQYDDKNAGEKYAADVKNIIKKLQENGIGITAFICETLLGVGGQIPLPENYLKNVYAYVRSAGGVCIADEVQVGFGRVGEKFWGFELQNVEPDIVVLGKPIGNGHPLAAVIVTQEIADAFNNGMEYFNTYGGNPVSMAAGFSVLNIIQQEELQKNAKMVGDILLEGLKNLMQKHTIIGDVRGHGLFVGAELVKDRKTKVPAIPEIDLIVEKMKERGFLLSTDGPLHNVLKIKPPIVFNEVNANELVKNLDDVLEELKIDLFPDTH